MKFASNSQKFKPQSIIRTISFLGALSFIACNSDDPVKDNPSSPALETRTEEIAGNLNHPWGLAFLPDGRMLVTERGGNLRVVDTTGGLSDPIAGLPDISVGGQGGLLDVALHPQFGENNMVYLTYTEAGSGGTSTALGRGVFDDNQLNDFEVLFSQDDKVSNTTHFGGRIVFSGEYLYVTLGERNEPEEAQNKSNHQGTIVRLFHDGSVPPDNPFANDATARPEIWSYGHRNVQSAAIDPRSGTFWVVEMGPQGGDELNEVIPGENYGWPTVSWGSQYSGEPIPDPPTQPQFKDAIIHWTPVISPSGTVFYTGTMFPEWTNHLLIGGLSAKGIVVVEVNGSEATEVSRMDFDQRIRNVRQAPDGSVYVLTDQPDGKILRIYKSLN